MGLIIEKNEIVKYKEEKGVVEVNIPAGIKSIAPQSFEGLKIKSVQLSEGIITIGYNAFKGCNGLEKVVVPKSVKMADNAFTNCAKLEYLEILNEEASAYNVIDGCKSIKYVKASEKTMETVFRFASPAQKARLCYNYLCHEDNNAEYDKVAKKMAKKVVAMIVEDDNAKALSRLFSLYKKPMTINELDEYIEMFAGKVNLTAFVIDYKNRNYSTVAIDKNEAENVEKELGIKEKTLAEWRKIFGLSISSDHIGISKYKKTDSCVEIPACIDKKPVTELCANLFDDNGHIQTVLLPNTIQFISWNVFSQSSIEYITIPESVAQIGMFAFEGCEKLKKVEFEIGADKKISIDDDAFDSCPNVVFIAKAGGYVEKYAKDHGIKFQAK